MTPATNTTEAVLWASVETLLQRSIQFVAGVALARLVAPDQFGLLAMLAVFVAVASVLAESGFASALVQKQELAEADMSTAFWSNIGAATLIAFFLGLSAPWISRFYGQTELLPLTWAMSLNLWLASWQTTHVALLTRELNFRLQAYVSGASNLVGSVVGVSFALKGAGAWSLVAQALATTVVSGAMLWRRHAWRPRFLFRVASFRKLFGFGGFMLASSLLDAFSTRLYSLVIGRNYSSRDLGIYARAVSTRDLTQGMLGTVFSKVSLAVLSRHSADMRALRGRLAVANQFTMAVNLPAMVGLAAVANIAVPLLFGPRWANSGPLLQILCIGGALWPLQVSNLRILMALGRSDLLFILEVLKKGLLAAGILVAYRHGMDAIAWATSGCAVIAFLINASYTRKILGYGALGQIADLGPYLLLSAAMGLLVMLLDACLPPMPAAARLAIDVGAGASFYALMAAGLRLPAVGFAIDVLRSISPGKAGREA